MGVSEVGKNNSPSFILIVNLVSGLPTKTKDKCFRIKYEETDLVIEEITGVFKYKVIQTFRLSLDKIISMDIVTEDNIEEKKKSVIGRGVAGAVVFGPVGAIIGSASGVGSKKKVKKNNYFVISYFGADCDEVKTITFDQLGDIKGKLMECEQQFIDYYNYQYANKFTEDENGEIIL